MHNGYSVQGWLVKQEADSMRYDMSGNLVFRSSSATDSTVFDMTPLGQPFATNRLQKATIKDPSGQVVVMYLHDANGARYREYDYSHSSTSRYRSWYDGMGRPTGSVDIWKNSTSNYGADGCGYDPLGNMAKPCQTLQPVLTFDGANVVGSGFPGGNAAQNPAWSFVHGPGTDDPLIGLFNTGNVVTPTYNIYYYVTDGAGRHLAVGDSAGWLSTADYKHFSEDGGVYAGGTSNGFSFGASRFDGGARNTSRSFFRNRIYDQNTGRWNQEDPIGVAGGVNLYQFNGNNPAAYTDPFGLCDEKADPTCRLFNAVGGILRPAQGPMEVMGSLAVAPLAGPAGLGGISAEVLDLGAVLGSSSSGLLRAGGVATRVADAVGGTVSALQKSDGYRVTVEGAKNIVARIKSSGEVRVSIDRLGASTREGMISGERTLTHLKDLSSGEIAGLVNAAKQLIAPQ